MFLTNHRTKQTQITFGIELKTALRPSMVYFPSLLDTDQGRKSGGFITMSEDQRLH